MGVIRMRMVGMGMMFAGLVWRRRRVRRAGPSFLGIRRRHDPPGKRRRRRRIRPRKTARRRKKRIREESRERFRDDGNGDDGRGDDRAEGRSRLAIVRPSAASADGANGNALDEMQQQRHKQWPLYKQLCKTYGFAVDVEQRLVERDEGPPCGSWPDGECSSPTAAAGVIAIIEETTTTIIAATIT